MLPFSAFDPAAITAEVNAVSICHDFGSFVPFSLLQSNSAFAEKGLSRVSMSPIPLTPLTATVRTLNVPERELVQPRPRPGGLVFRAGGLPLRPLSPLLFPSKGPPLLAQFQVFSTQVLAFVLLTCWVQHSQHASTSSLSILLLTRVCPPSTPTLLASGPTFSAAALYQLGGCHGKRFRFVGLHHHQSMLLAGLYCKHRRVFASIDVMKGHRFMRELYGQHAE